MLGLGAWIVLLGEMTPGMMIAGSILLGRALAPVEQLIGGWTVVGRARQGWTSLKTSLEKTPAERAPMPLPAPRAQLELTGVTVVPPDQQRPTLRMVSFKLKPGQALGVIGPSASGKSTLARTLAGIWRPVAGAVRLDGAELDHYGNDLGRYIGYLPQDIALFEGTVAENIARMAVDPDFEAVVAAAKKAGAHEMVLRLPDGYDTQINVGGARLSGGQRQRIALARALYGDPALVVLDEPNSNLDGEGGEALMHAIRQLKADGRIVIIMAHRPAAISECDLLLVVHEGASRPSGRATRCCASRSATTPASPCIPRRRSKTSRIPQTSPAARPSLQLPALRRARLRRAHHPGVRPRRLGRDGPDLRRGHRHGHRRGAGQPPGRAAPGRRRRHRDPRPRRRRGRGRRRAAPARGRAISAEHDIVEGQLFELWPARTSSRRSAT